MRNFLLLVLGLLSGVLNLVAQPTYHVRAGATGAYNGLDWANAFTSLPATLIRGATYYVADGTYPGYFFDDAPDGEKFITVKKAIQTDHGSSVAWDNSYGDGQAVFGPLRQNGGYLEVDGQVKYGFKVDFEEGQRGFMVGAGKEIRLKFIDFDGISRTGNYNYVAATKCIVISRGVTNLLVSNCALHGAESCIQEGDGLTGNGYDSTGTIVEYCHFYNSRSTASAYHNNIYFISGSFGGTFRHNLVQDYNDEGVFFTGWEGAPGGWKVYGNVFWGDGVQQNPRGIELRQGYSYTGIEIYNNTFINLPVGGVLNRTAETGHTTTSCKAYNNLAYKAALQWGNFQDVKSNMTATSDPFVSLLGSDFRLRSALSISGVSLAPPYDVDMLSNRRGADGVWDIGAYEFGSQPAGALSATPTTLDFGQLQVGSFADKNITLSNAGPNSVQGTVGATAPFAVVSGGVYQLAPGRTQIVTIRFQPEVSGTLSGQITVGNGAPAVSATGSGSLGLSFESTSGGITSPFSAINGFVSQGVETALAAGGRATYEFYLSEPGDYSLTINVIAPHEGANSVFLAIDQEPADPQMIWDIPVTEGAVDRLVSWRGTGSDVAAEFQPKWFTLNSGTHRLTIVGREPQTQIGRISLVRRPSPPQALKLSAQ
jgi:hypothetical protein